MKRSIYLKKLFRLLNIFFWIHSIGLTTNYKSKCKSKIATVASAFLAIFFEGNCFWLWVSFLSEFGFSTRKNKITGSFFLGYFTAGLLQRLCLCWRKRTLEHTVYRLAKISEKIQVKNSKSLKFKFILIISAFEALIFGIITVIIFDNYLSGRMVNNQGQYVFLYRIWHNVRLFCNFWKATPHCIVIYFTFMCFTLKGILQRLQEILPFINHHRWTLVYNETLDAMKTINDAFTDILFITSVDLLGVVFVQTYNIFFHWNSYYDTFKGSLLAILPFLSFMLMCLSASTVHNADKNVRYVVCKQISEEFYTAENDILATLSPHSQEFHLLDSIVIDKSLLLSAVGVLLTYGVMIATFSVSSM